VVVDVGTVVTVVAFVVVGVGVVVVSAVVGKGVVVLTVIVVVVGAMVVRGMQFGQLVTSTLKRHCLILRS